MDTSIAEAGAPLHRERPAADVFMRRLLRIEHGSPGARASAERAFSTSILVSATRCLLTYILLPLVAPILGLAAGVGPFLGIVIGLVAIAANVISMRRFWLADHRWRWAYTAVATSIIVLLLALLARDVSLLIA